MYTENDFGVMEEYYVVNEPILVGDKDELSCIKKAKEGDENYANFVLNNYKKYVVSIAKKFRNRGLEVEDLVLFGFCGLYEALKKFDVNNGAKFSTFANKIISGRIMREIENYGRTIRIPSNVLKEAWNVKKIFDEMGEDATIESLAEILGKTEKDVKNLLEMINPIAELDYYVDDEETTLCDLMPDDNECEKLEKIHSKQSECLREITKAFTNEESALVRALFNFDSEWNSGGSPTNLNAAAKELGVSYAVAQRILKSAGEKFRRGNAQYHIESLAA